MSYYVDPLPNLKSLNLQFRQEINIFYSKRLVTTWSMASSWNLNFEKGFSHYWAPEAGSTERAAVCGSTAPHCASRERRIPAIEGARVRQHSVAGCRKMRRIAAVQCLAKPWKGCEILVFKSCRKWRLFCSEHFDSLITKLKATKSVNKLFWNFLKVKNRNFGIIWRIVGPNLAWKRF